jgi:hypothetical protein
MALLNRVSGLDGTAVEEIFTGDINWEYIYQVGTLLGAAPILYHHLRRFKPATLVGTPVMDFFERQYHISSAKNLHLIHEFDRIAEKLSACGITCMGLKGVVLARLLYPTPALRPMFDIDLLVKEQDLTAACRVAETLGYRLPDETPSQTARPYHYHLHYVKKGPAPIYLEIHWGLGQKNRYRIDNAGIWERAHESPWGQSMLMSDDDTFLYLCQHFFKHFLFKRLSWICDIYEWIEQKEINWDRVFHAAQSQGMATFLTYTLKVVSEFYEMKVPDQITNLPDMGILRRKVLDRYLNAYGMFNPMEKNSWPQKRLFAFCAIDRMSDRLRFTWDVLRRDLA